MKRGYRMNQNLMPNERIDRIDQIDFYRLKGNKIHNLILDLDNTLTSWNNTEVLPQVMDWICQGKEFGFSFCILSNNGAKRVKEYAKKLDIQAVFNAGKPRKKAFLKALQVLDCDATSCAVIGDQIFMDIMGGNRSGIYTILVMPISRREFIGTRLLRILEAHVLRKL